MYDKTIGGTHIIWTITPVGSWTRVLDLLDANQRAEYDALIEGKARETTEADGFNTYDLPIKRRIVDGYMRCPNGVLMVATKPVPAGDVENVPVNEIYPIPVHDWLIKTWVMGTDPITLRVFFS